MIEVLEFYERMQSNRWDCCRTEVSAGIADDFRKSSMCVHQLCMQQFSACSKCCVQPLNRILSNNLLQIGFCWGLFRSIILGSKVMRSVFLFFLRSQNLDLKTAWKFLTRSSAVPYWIRRYELGFSYRFSLTTFILFHVENECLGCQFVVALVDITLTLKQTKPKSAAAACFLRGWSTLPAQLPSVSVPFLVQMLLGCSWEKPVLKNSAFSFPDLAGTICSGLSQ